MTRAVAWMVARFRPDGGWAAYLLVLVAVACLPAALMQAAQRLPTLPWLLALRPIHGSLLVLALTGATAGALVSNRVPRRATSLFLCVSLGLGLAIVIVGRLVPPWSLLESEIESALRWLRSRQAGLTAWPLPLGSTVEFVGQRLSLLAGRLWWDLHGLLAGGPAWNTAIYVLAACLFHWIAAFAAAWFIYCRRAALAALLPLGGALAVVVFFESDATSILFAFIFCLLWLVATCHLWTRWDRWHQTGTDYPDNLGIELLLNVGPWIFAFVILGGLIPNTGFWRVSRAFWEQTERIFGPWDGGYPGGPGGGDSMPRSHLLGGGPELARTLVFTVASDDPAPPLPYPEAVEQQATVVPPRYWRGQTLDLYTGRGWASTPLDAQALSPGQSLPPESVPGPELRQRFQLVTGGEGLLFAANDPVRVDHDVEVWWRGPRDLAWLSSSAQRYVVWSSPPDPDVEQLRTAPLADPPDLRARHLALPADLPQRVVDLAARIVGQAETRYDQVLALETYLRSYEYSLDVPLPPSGRDAVDYFLFDLQKGYCDYYASALVIMARSVGIPARFATGYSQGQYDYEKNHWVVTEEDGHSWAEVYFYGIGWLEFEPTAGRPALDRRSGTAVMERPVVPPLPAHPRNWWQNAPWSLVGLAGILLLLATVVARIWRSGLPRELPPAGLVRDRYARMLLWGSRAGVPLTGGQTATEYGTHLGSALRVRSESSRWAKLRGAARGIPVDVDRLAETFARVQYGPKSIGLREASGIRALWHRLRAHLAYLWLTSAARRNRGP